MKTLKVILITFLLLTCFSFGTTYNLTIDYEPNQAGEINLNSSYRNLDPNKTSDVEINQQLSKIQRGFSYFYPDSVPAHRDFYQEIEYTKLELIIYGSESTVFRSTNLMKVYIQSNVSADLNGITLYNTIDDGTLIDTLSASYFGRTDTIDISNYLNYFTQTILDTSLNDLNLFISYKSSYENYNNEGLAYIECTLRLHYNIHDFVKLDSKFTNSQSQLTSISTAAIDAKEHNANDWQQVSSGGKFEVDKEGSNNYDFKTSTITSKSITDGIQTYDVYHYNWNENESDYKLKIEDKNITSIDDFSAIYKKKESLTLGNNVIGIQDPWAISSGYVQPNIWIDTDTISNLKIFPNVDFNSMPYYQITTEPYILETNGTYTVFNEWNATGSSVFQNSKNCTTKVNFAANDNITVSQFTGITLSNSVFQENNNQLYLKLDDGNIYATQNEIKKLSSLIISPSNGAIISTEDPTWGYPIEICCSNVSITPVYTTVNTIQDYELTVEPGASNSLTIPSGADITCASGFEIKLQGDLIIDGSSSAISIQGSGKETTFDSSSVRPPVPNTSLINIASNSAQLTIKNAIISDYSCAIRVKDDVNAPNISIENSVIDDCNIGIMLNKVNNQDIEITKTVFSNSHNGIVFGPQMYDEDQESNLEISFCTFYNIEDYGIFMFQEQSTNPNSNVVIFTFNNTFHNVGTSIYNDELTGLTSGTYQVLSYNNIFSYSDINIDPANLNEASNLIYNSAATYFDDGNDIFQDPVFTNASNGDFSLQISSPAIDSGDDILPNLGDEYFIDSDGTVPDRGAIPYNFPGLAGKRRGTLIIDKDTTIATGYTGTLVSGSVLRFNAGCGLIVEGTLEANNISYRPNTTTTSLTYWDGINGSNGSDIDLRNCTIRNAAYGVKTSSGIVYLDNCDIDSCDNGGYLHTPSSGSTVKYCDFDYNDKGLKILYNTNYITVRNNTFTNNDSWAIYLTQSNTNLYDNIINNNEDGVWSWRSNGTYSRNSITNSNDDGIAFLQYASVDMNAEWDAQHDKPTNNVITGHGDDGVIVTYSAAPDLGTAETIIPEEMLWAGFNTIDNNGGLDVYRTSTGAYINAQGNDWGASCNISSGVETDPDKATIDQGEFYKTNSRSINLVSYDNPLDKGLKLERDSLFTEAIVFYKDYLDNNNNKNTTVAIQAVVRLARCYFKLDTPIDFMVNELSSLYQQYGNTNAGNTAKHYLAGLYVCQGKYSKALQCNNEMINTFVENFDSEMAANAYMDGVIFCETIPETNSNGLNKTTLQNNKEAYIAQLIKLYPQSDAAKTIAEMYDIQIPEAILPIDYKLYKCYPNPFNPETTIGFDLPIAGDVTIELFDIRGHFIKYILKGEFNPGYHEYVANISDLGSGIYIYKLTSGNFTAVNKMTLLK